MSVLSIAVVGLGNMGRGMAERLAARGHRVVGIDPRAAELEPASFELRSDGLPAAVDAAVLSLHPSITAKVIDDLLQSSSPPAVVVDTGTNAPGESAAAAAAAAARGIEYVEAPVSGGPSAAREGRMAIFVGANSPLSPTAHRVLDTLGTPWELGAVGAGQSAKLINNLIVGANFAVLAEAFAIARRSELDLTVLGEALHSGAADSWVARDAWPRMVDGDVAARGTIELHARDLVMAKTLADALGVETTMAPASAELFDRGVANGLGALAQHGLYHLWESEPSRLGEKA